MAGRSTVLACSPLPRPTWSPPPVVANPFGDAFEVAAAVLAMCGGVVIFSGPQVTPSIRKRAFSDAGRLADFRRQRPETVFGIRLGAGGGGVVAVEIPGTPDARHRMTELTTDLGPIPQTLTLVEGARRWCIYRLPNGVAAPVGRVCLGDSVAVLASGRGLPLPPYRTAWAEGAAPGEAVIAALPPRWVERLSPAPAAPTVRWFE